MTDIRFSDILSTQLEANGAILAQSGDVVSEEVFSVDTEIVQPIGFASRPSIPTAAGAAQGVCISQPDRDLCVGIRDLRSSTIYGSIKDGETCVYAAGPEGEGTGRILMKDDGITSSITLLLQKDNESTGVPVTLQLKSDGSLQVALATFGALVFNEDGFKVGCGSAALELKSTGEVNIIGTKININGGAILLGPTASVATPMTVGPVGATAVGSTCIFGSA